MTATRTRRTAWALCATGALVLAGCTAVDDDPAPGDTNGGNGADGEIVTSTGVTTEPCPDAVNPDNGCIYLGVLSDLTEGPFAALAVPITDAQGAYWDEVNEAGGIHGFDVDIRTYTRDTKYQAAEHAAAYQQIEPNILALAQTLGTVNTEAILADMDANDVVGVPASWWSGYNFTANDQGLILENGYSYCIESAVGLDWFTENHGDVGSVAAVGYPGDYGGDSAAGVEMWAEINGVDDVTVVPTGPNQVTGNQDAVVAAVLGAEPDVVVMAIGPAETAEIVGKLAASGFTGRFLGSLPTWNPALLDSGAAEALIGLYNHMSPSQQWDADSAGAQAMRDSLDGDLPVNTGYLIGWVMNYGLHGLLEKAAENGDLTRAGLRAAVDGLEVDFGGMMPAVTFGGEGKDVAISSVVVSTPDPGVDLGLASDNEFFTGSTFDQMPYEEACSASS